MVVGSPSSWLSDAVDAEAEALEPAPSAGLPLGGNLVVRGLDDTDLLVRVAEVLQEDLAETGPGWGQSRPPCPHHPHPLRAAVREDEGWVCERLDDALHRVGRAEIPTGLAPPPTWHPADARRARKRNGR